MSNFKNWVKENTVPRVNNAVSVDSASLDSWVNGGLSSAGVSVNEQTVQKISSVYACVGLIGGAIASMPLPIYQNSADGRKKADHDYWWLLNRNPNDEYSASVFWEAITGSLLLHGDGFARIIRPSNRSNIIIGFEWLQKKNVEVKKDGKNLIYIITDGIKKTAVMAADMLHIPGQGFNGLTGMSQISYVLKNAAGIALAADNYSAEFFANGARPDFVIQTDLAASHEDREALRKSWSDRYSGSGKNHLPAIMSGGMKVQEMTMNAEDSQLISTRQFQVEDIARIFGVPPHMIGHTQSSTSWGTGVEQMSIGFVKYTLARHLTKIEQELNRKLFPNQKDYFVEFNTAGLERGDYKTRMEGYRVALGRAGEPGWMTTNEIRKLENQAPISGGDELNSGVTNESNA